MHFTIDAEDFMGVVGPLLDGGEPTRLAAAITARWRPRQLGPLLRHEGVEVRRLAALALGLVGDSSVTACLTRALRDADEQVHQMAEHGLWSIWFRGGDPEAYEPFRAGVAQLDAGAYKSAIEQFCRATAIDPDFSEAFNQTAIAQYLLGRWRGALDNCRHVISQVPCHFGALTGMGHSHAELGDLGQALECYRRSLSVNPRMPGIIGAVRRLEARLGADSQAAGASQLHPRG